MSRSFRFVRRRGSCRILGLPAAGLALLLAASLSATSADAADNPLPGIPDTADIVLRFGKPKKTLDNLNKFMTGVDQKLATEVRKMVSSIGVLIGNAQGAGVDTDLDWYVAFFVDPKAPGGSLAPAFVIPTKKASDFEAAVKQTMPRVKFRQQDKWTIYSENEAAMAKMIEAGSGKARSISTRLDGEAQTAFDKADLAVFVNVRHLTEETYKVEIEAAKAELDAALADINTIVPKSTSPFDLKPVFTIYAETERALLQAALDVEGATISMKLGATGVDLDTFVKIKSGSPTAGMLASNEGSTMSVLEKMPANRLLYFATHGNHKGLTNWRLKLGQAVAQDAAVATSLGEVMSAYEQLEVGTQAFAFSLGDMKNGMFRTVSVSEMKPADQARDVTRKLLAATSAVNLSQINRKLEFEEEAEETAGQKVDVAKIVDTSEAGGGGNMFAELFVSGDASTTRIAYLPEHVVETFGGGSAVMAEVINSLGVGGAAKKATGGSTTGGASGAAKPNTGIASTRLKLAPNANMVALIDLPGFLADGLKTVADIPLIGAMLSLSPDQMKKLNLRRSYTGFSMVNEAGGVRVRGHIPQTQLKGLASMQTILTPIVQTGIRALGGNSSGAPGAMAPR